MDYIDAQTIAMILFSLIVIAWRRLKPKGMTEEEKLKKEADELK